MPGFVPKAVIGSAGALMELRDKTDKQREPSIR
jgi:hypothetical protein